MLAARGVSLGLGKINLSELNQLPVADRATLGRIARAKKKQEAMKPRLIVKKRVDRQVRSMRLRKRMKKRKKAGIRRANAIFLKSYYARNKKTLFQACKAVIFGSLFIAAGLAMTVLGFFNQELATSDIFNTTAQAYVAELDDTKRVIFKGMQYVGPVCMGFGAFAMIIACVMTLESRDRHAQIIQEESNEYRKLKNQLETEATKTSLLSPFEESIEIVDEGAVTNGNNGNKSEPINAEASFPNGHTTLTSEKCSSLPITSSQHYPITKPTALSASTSPIELSVHRFLNVNMRKPRGPAPIAEADSFLDLTITATSSTTPNGFSSSPKRSSVRSIVESSD